MKHYDVAVIRLGMVGASAVYAAAGAGARVLALDAGPPGGGTSGTSFAWLNSVRKEPDVYHRLNAAGMTAHRELSRELGGDAGYHDGGSLEWADAGDEERELRERVHRLPTRRYPPEGISRERPSQLQPGPALPDRFPENALLVTDRALGAATVKGLPRNPGLAARLPEHGALLLDRTARVFPAARHVKIADTRIGVRPMPGDRHTIAGRVPGFVNAWVIATHSGITLGPLLGRLLADEIVRDAPSPALAPFRPDRFLTAAATTG